MKNNSRYLSASAVAESRRMYDDPVHYHVYRCGACGYTTARMALYSARCEAVDHEPCFGRLFTGRIYDAEPERRRAVSDELKSPARWYW